MDRVFPALQRRFDRDPELRKFGRKLFLGSPANTRTPVTYVEVECNGVTNDNDTFSTTEPVYDLTFTVYSGEKRHDRCSRVARALQRVYHDCDLEGSGFETSMMICSPGPGPILEDGRYRQEVNASLHVTLTDTQPARRFE